MIDENWLQQLDFESFNGLKIKGLAGLGSENVVLKGILPDGKQVVVKTRKNHLGFYLKEIPPFLTVKREYDVDRLNRKLYSLIGNPVIDEMSNSYDKLHSFVLKIAHEPGIEGLILGIRTPESVETVPFILKSPGVKAVERL